VEGIKERQNGRHSSAKETCFLEKEKEEPKCGLKVKVCVSEDERV